MTTGLLEDREQQHASVRAQAAAIADAPRPPRRYALPETGELRASQRRRRHVRPVAAAPPERRPLVSRRLLAGFVLLAQLALLICALELPVFQVSTVDVSGEHVLSAQQIMNAAAVPHQSIFTVDATAVRNRVLQLPWVESVTVTTQLPATVRIAVVERTPAVRIRRFGVDTFVAADGEAVAATPYLEHIWKSTPALIDERAGSTQPIDPRLLVIMQETAARYQALYGVQVSAYLWGSDDVFSIWSTNGWAAILGHLDTEQAIAEVPAQLAALYAIRSQVDLTHPTFGYVNLENPSAPAVGGSPGWPPEVIQVQNPPVPVLPAPPYTGPPLTQQPMATPSAAPSLKPLASAAATPLPIVSAPPTPPPPPGQTPPTQD